MKTVWKYPFPEGKVELDVELPLGASVVHFALPKSNPTFWALVRPGRVGAPQIKRTFRIVGTGEPWNEHDWSYLASATSEQLVATPDSGGLYHETGAFVFHLLEKRHT